MPIFGASDGERGFEAVKGGSGILELLKGGIFSVVITRKKGRVVKRYMALKDGVFHHKRGCARETLSEQESVGMGVVERESISCRCFFITGPQLASPSSSSEKEADNGQIWVEGPPACEGGMRHHELGVVYKP